MWNSFVFLSLALAQTVEPQSVGFSQPIVSRAYESVAPALCVLSYSYETQNPSTGARKKQDSQSAGIIVAPNGLVMARGHVALDNVEPFNIRIEVGRGEAAKEYAGTLLRKPRNINVAFVRIESTEPLQLPSLRFAQEPRLKLGEPVAIFGLLGQALDHNPAVIVRRIGSVLTSPRTTYCLDDPITAGFIGGPVVNAQGEVVGVVGYDLSTSEGGDVYVRSGHPLVYQADLFARYIENPPGEDGDSESDAWLGVFTQPLTDDLAEYWSLEKSGGAVVSTVMPGSPAEAAGIRRGDIVTGFNGMAVRPKQDLEVSGLTKLIRDAGVGAQATLDLLRDGKPLQVAVTLAPQPKQARDAGEFKDEVFGLTVRELTTDVRIMLNLPDETQGVIVRSVEAASWAALARLRPGVIIMGFGGQPVTDLKSFQSAVEQVAKDKPLEVPVFARVGHVTGFFRLEPRWTNEEK